MSALITPEIADLGSMIGDLVGTDVTLSEGPGVTAPSHVARFVFDDGSLAYECVADLATVVHLGCALVLIPPGAAEEQVEAGAARSEVVENFHEVMNVSSSAFNLAGSAHLRLDTVHTGPVEGTGEKITLTIEVARYGTSTMDVHAAS